MNPIIVERLSTPGGDYILQSEEEARSAHAQIDALKRRATAVFEAGMKAEAELEGTGRELLAEAASLQATAQEMEHRQAEEESIREDHGAAVIRATFEAEPISLPMRQSLQEVIDRDGKDREGIAQAALDLLFPGGVKAPPGFTGEITDELRDVLKGRALAAFYRSPTEDRRSFLLKSRES